MSLFSELKRRNVIRVGLAYVVAGWVLVEVADILLPAFEAPAWVIRAVILSIIGGLPVAIFFAWMFELTPAGIKRDDGIASDEQMRFGTRTGRRIDLMIMVFLGLAVSYFVLEKIWLSDYVRGDKLRSIVVLPFTDMSPRRNQEYFAEGLTIELLNRLSRTTDLKVIGRTSAFQFKDYSGNFRDIGNKLGVGTILEGSVRAVDNNIRVTIQLVDAEQGKTLWSANFDRQLSNVFQVQDEIAKAVVDALKGRLLDTAVEEEARQIPPEAWKAYQQGRYLQSQSNVESQNRAISYFEQARQLDSTYAEPLLGLADAHLRLTLNLAEMDRDEGLSKASTYIEEALRLDSKSVNAYGSRGFIKMVLRDFVGAELDYKRALEIDPNYGQSLSAVGTLYGWYGRYDEAMGVFQKIIDRDPLSHTVYSNYSYTALAAGDVELAESLIRKAIEFRPSMSFANYHLSRVLLARGAIEDAIEANDRETLPVWKTIGEGMISCKQGNSENAIAIAESLVQQGEVFNAAEIYGLCGDSEKVFELLNRAAEAGDPALLEMRLSWQLTGLREDPRWFKILEKIGLQYGPPPVAE
jgi:TolB-like protein/Flp pilus assembly protein TadD